MNKEGSLNNNNDIHSSIPQNGSSSGIRVISAFDIEPFNNDVIRGKALWKQSLHELS